MRSSLASLARRGGAEQADIESRSRAGGWLSRHAELSIFLFYVAFTVFLTWPLVTRFTTSIYGVPGDNLGGIWYFWWLRNASSFSGSASFSPMLGFPFGAYLGAVPMEPVSYLFSRFLLLFANEVIVYNLDIFLSFLLSGVTMYYLVRHVTGDRRAAVIGGFAYLIMPYHAYHSMYIAGGISTVQWMPLYILMLLKFIEKPAVRSAAFLALGAVLVAGTSVHYGVFMAVFTLAFLAGRYVYARIRLRGDREAQGLTPKEPVRVNRKTLVLSLIVLVVFLAAVLPFVYPGLWSGGEPTRWPTVPTPAELRIEPYIVANAAKPLDYVKPGSTGFLGKTELRNEAPVYDFQASLYTGWALLALAAFCLVSAAVADRKKTTALVPPGSDGNPEDQKPASFTRVFLRGRSPVLWGFAAAAVTSFLMSLKPYAYIGKTRVPMPSRLLMAFVPLLRWYLRMGVVFNICVVVLACAGLAVLIKRWKRGRAALFLALLVFVLAAELLVVPPFRSFSFEKVPKVIEGVADLPDDSAVAFYPLSDSGAFWTSKLKFYQRWFEKPMLNGAPGGSDGEAVRRVVFNPFDPDSPSVLRALGYTHAVIFEDYYLELGFDRALLEDPVGYERIDTFRGDGGFARARLFTIKSTAARVMPVYLDNITVPVFDGPTVARLVGADGVVRLENMGEETEVVDVDIPIDNPFTPREVAVLAGGKTLWSGRLEDGEGELVELRGVDVPAGGVDLVISGKGTAFAIMQKEARLFGVQRAYLRLGDVSVRSR